MSVRPSWVSPDISSPVTFRAGGRKKKNKTSFPDPPFELDLVRRGRDNRQHIRRLKPATNFYPSLTRWWMLFLSDCFSFSLPLPPITNERKSVPRLSFLVSGGELGEGEEILESEKVLKRKIFSFFHFLVRRERGGWGRKKHRRSLQMFENEKPVFDIKFSPHKMMRFRLPP